MKRFIDEHGQTVTVIGTIRGLRPGERREVTITEFGPPTDPTFSLKDGICGNPDAKRFATQVRRAKQRLSDPSLEAEWYV